MDNNDKIQHQSSQQPHPHHDSGQAKSDHAANLIRGKLDSLYGAEPDAQAEAQEVAAVGQDLSIHQQYMYELSNSGNSVAEIQAAWHNYYAGLPDDQKHEVWNEFYAANKQSSHYMKAQAAANQPDSAATAASFPEPDSKPEKPLVEPYLAPNHATQSSHRPEPAKSHHKKHTVKPKSVADIKHQLVGGVKPRRKLKAKQHMQSLMFGLAMGAIVLLILLFGFFNERFIAPFITPSKHVSSTPIIVEPGSNSASPYPWVIVPKINVEVPVVYEQKSIDEVAMQSSLEQGVVHYATTPYPGELGNSVFFGHSSSNIFNSGKYKFAFVLLNRLEVGDLFYLTRDGKQYVYKVYKKHVVEPTDLSVLNPSEKPATATLITCDPPGTSVRRLVVVGEQITPSPTANTTSTASASTTQPAVLPSNSPSLWGRFVHWLD